MEMAANPDGHGRPAAMDVDAVARSRARLPNPPSQRTEIEWDVSLQAHKGRHATCRSCCSEFGSNDLRFSRSSDARAGAARYLHAACVPGGFHPQDTFTGIAAAEQRALDLISSFRNTTDGGQQPEPPIALPQTAMACGDAWWETLPWHAADELTCGTLIDIPNSLKMAYALFKDDAVVEAVRAGCSPAASARWRKVSFMDSLILNDHRPEGESQAQSVTRRLQQASDGDWHSLWLEATPPIRNGHPNAVATDEARALFVRDLALAGEPGRALKALKKRLPICRDPRRADEVQAMFPACDGPTLSEPCPEQHKWLPEEIQTLADIIARRLLRPKKRKAQGRLGGRLEHWQVLHLAEAGIEHAAELLANLAIGRVPEDVIAAHARCELAPTSKPNSPGLRPLQLGSVCRRIAMGGLVQFARDAVQIAVGPDQLALGTKDGCTKAYQAIRSKCRAQPHRAVLAEDVEAAHQHLDRTYAATKIEKHCPKLLEPFLTWYGRTSMHSWFTADGRVVLVPSSRGLDQGDPFANPVFAIAVADPAHDLRERIKLVDPEGSVIQSADDLQMCVTPAALELAAREARALWTPAGLSFGAAKRQCWSMSCALLPEPFQACRVQRLRRLGNTLDDETDNAEPTLPQLGAEAGGEDVIRAATKIAGVGESIKNVIHHGLPRQVGQNLFRYAAAGQTQHLIAAKAVPQQAVQVHDAQLRATWSDILDIDLTDAAWTRGNLSMKDGGCAFGAIEHRAPTALLACLSRTHPYVCRHVGLNGPEALLLGDPGLAAELGAAAAAMRRHIPAAIAIPWENGTVPGNAIKQSALLGPYCQAARKTFLESLDDRGAAILRSCGGPGAGGFLTTQSDANVLMDNTTFKVAIARRLGGWPQTERWNSHAVPPLRGQWPMRPGYLRIRGAWLRLFCWWLCHSAP